MSYKVVLTHSFKQSVKRLGKRFRHVKEDVRTAIEVLERTPNLGVLIPNGFEVRKLRVANSDLAKGKSGGYRLLYQLTEPPEPRLNLLLLYAKSDQADVTKDELRQLLDELTGEPTITDAATDDSPADTD
jgi:mRNA-degrading endonuclease RelE of RelBE toxin-antitoxin system